MAPGPIETDCPEPCPPGPGTLRGTTDSDAWHLRKTAALASPPSSTPSGRANWSSAGSGSPARCLTFSAIRAAPSIAPPPTRTARRAMRSFTGAPRRLPPRVSRPTGNTSSKRRASGPKALLMSSPSTSSLPATSGSRPRASNTRSHGRRRMASDEGPLSVACSGFTRNPATILVMSTNPSVQPPDSTHPDGPRPSGAHPRVLTAMTAPILGHLDPAFLRIMT